jgi:hypothetical protein
MKNDQQSPTPTPTAGRRRMLQGLAAPLVMTVVPGTALANGSAGMCLARCDADARGPKKAKVFKTGTDEWVRVRRQLYKLKIRKNNKFTELEGRKFFIGFDNSRFWELKTVGGVLTAATTNYFQGAPDVQATSISTSYTYALAYVDKDGAPQGFGVENTHSGQIASTSCWNSLKGLKTGGSKFLNL